MTDPNSDKSITLRFKYRFGSNTGGTVFVLSESRINLKEKGFDLGFESKLSYRVH